MKLEYGFSIFILYFLCSYGKIADNCCSYSLVFFTFPFGISFCFMVHNNISFSDWIIWTLSIAYLSVSVTGILFIIQYSPEVENRISVELSFWLIETKRKLLMQNNLRSFQLFVPSQMPNASMLCYFYILHTSCV